MHGSVGGPGGPRGPGGRCGRGRCGPGGGAPGGPPGGPPGGRVRGFIQPRILLSLLQQPCHGYELMERLGNEGGGDGEAGGRFVGPDPGLLYRTLRQLEEAGLVQSTWETEGGGPARRLYEVTPEGVEYLHAWAATIRRTRARLDRFLREYEAHFGARGEGRGALEGNGASRDQHTDGATGLPGVTEPKEAGADEGEGR